MEWRAGRLDSLGTRGCNVQFSREMPRGERRRECTLMERNPMSCHQQEVDDMIVKAKGIQ